MEQSSLTEEIRIELEEIEEQEEEEEASLPEQYGVSPDQFAVAVPVEQSAGQPEEKEAHPGPRDGRASLVKDRDPKGINKSLKVTFEDVIAEPVSVHSFDKVWLWSHALFEVSRLWFYRIISLVLAVPVALVAGILFAILSCLHIWLIVPSMQILLINMHWVKTVWASVLDIAISPFFSSVGRCFGAISIRLAQD
ncbi:caveolin-2-like [Chanos chanos]|uniref:Caveolin n=1 Tax=Chanos chanos TaxID=29144 RepID=A0A6J2VMY4_CHACN|nr:caveolin-2-like [Chanos chanos]